MASITLLPAQGVKLLLTIAGLAAAGFISLLSLSVGLLTRLAGRLRQIKDTISQAFRARIEGPAGLRVIALLIRQGRQKSEKMAAVYVRRLRYYSTQ